MVYRMAWPIAHVHVHVHVHVHLPAHRYMSEDVLCMVKHLPSRLPNLYAWHAAWVAWCMVHGAYIGAEGEVVEEILLGSGEDNLPYVYIYLYMTYI